MAQITPSFDSINLSGISLTSSGGNTLLINNVPISGAAGGSINLDVLLNQSGPKYILFNSGQGSISGSVNLQWDYTNESLNIGQATILPDNPLAIAGNGVYEQANLQNRSNSSGSSSDWVATCDVGSDISGYIDFGINSSTYNQTGYSIVGAQGGYLYVNGGDLAVGTQSVNKVIKFHTAGTTSGQLRATIDNSGINLPSSCSFRINNQLPTFTKAGGFYNQDGLASGDYRTAIWRAPFPCVATGVHGYIISGTSALVQAIKNSSNLLNQNLNVTSTLVWVSSGILQNQTFAQGDTLTINLVRPTNGPVSVSVQVDFVRT